MNKDVDKIIDLVDYIIKTTDLVKNEPLPDWINQHDYSSGFFMGRQNASRINAVNLAEIKRLLEELNGKVPS